jgi:anti-sigma regulatory factor (Ser/Thr protein kinase)
MGSPSAPAVLTIDATSERLAEVRSFIRAVALAADADEETTADLVQAVDELVCNVIEHGYGGEPGTIDVDARVTGGALVVRIRDRAAPFDPRSVPPPALDLPLERRPLGGMGVHLARTLTDRLDHRILPGGGNEVTLSKRLRPRTARESNDGDHDRPAERRPRGHRPVR